MGRAMKNSENLNAQGSLKAPLQTCINVHLLQETYAQTILLCCKSQLLVGQLYAKEIQDRKYLAEARLVEAITQCCRALQPNSHGPLTKSFKIHSLKWLKPDIKT